MRQTSQDQQHPGRRDPETQEQMESYSPASSQTPCSYEDRPPRSRRMGGSNLGPHIHVLLGSQRWGQGLQHPQHYLEPLPEPPTLAKQASLPLHSAE